jgi:hypothetical protein
VIAPIGPGFGDLFERLPAQPEQYFVNYITEYDSMLKVDQYTQNVKKQYKDVESYHQFKQLTTPQIQDLMTYLKTWDRAVH